MQYTVCNAGDRSTKEIRVPRRSEEPIKVETTPKNDDAAVKPDIPKNLTKPSKNKQKVSSTKFSTKKSSTAKREVNNDTTRKVEVVPQIEKTQDSDKITEDPDKITEDLSNIIEAIPSADKKPSSTKDAEAKNQEQADTPRSQDDGIFMSF